MNNNPNSIKITKEIAICETIAIILIIGMAVFMFLSRTHWLEECEKPFVEAIPDRGEWYRVYDDGHREAITLPVTFEEMPANRIVAIEGTIQEGTTDKDYISTRANRQNLRIYVDGELRGKTEQIFEFFHWSIIISRYISAPVSSADIGKTIRIEGTSPFEETRAFEKIVYGEKIAIELGYAKENMFTLITAVIMVLMGAIMLVFGVVLRLLTNNRVRSDYIGTTMILISIWNLTLCDFSDFLFTNVIAIKFIPAVAVSLIPMLIVLYIDSVQERRYHRMYMIYFIVAVVAIPVCIFLHVNKILMYPMCISIPIALLAVLVILFVSNTITDAKKGLAHYYKFVIVGICILGVMGIAQGIVSLFIDESVHSLLIIGCILMMPLIFADGIQFMFHLENEKKQAMVKAEIKSQFLSTMSHEIRTPINAVLGMNEIILRESNEENIKDYAADIEGAGKLLLSIVNDILDLSMLENGKMDIVSVDYNIGDCIRACLQMVEKRAEDKNLRIIVEVDPMMPATLNGDQVRVQQILTNLLTNAVKYTPEGSVQLIVRAEQNGDNCNLKITVSDTGIGIKEESLGSLFNNFERLDLEKNVNIEGTGLGLSITDKLVRLMGGEITVESEYGKGSAFTVVLPQKVVSDEKIGGFIFGNNTHKKAVATEDLFTAENVKILIVDDVALNLKVAVAMLKKTGIEVQTAESGFECLEKVTKEKYDAIFLDHMMPEMDGVETRQKMLKMADNLNVDTPVIMLTANVSADAKEKYRRKGFTDYLSKPFGITDIERILLTYLPAEKVRK